MTETSNELTVAVAEHILARMGETGQPPEQGIQFVNVGNEQLLNIIDTEYLDRLLNQARGSAFKLVQGYFGGGKTHFLYCVRALAWNKGFPTAVVRLSPQECPYEDPYLVYKSVASAISAPPAFSGETPSEGITDLLRFWAEDNLMPLSPEERDKWFRTVALRLPVESHTYRRAAAEFIRCLVNNDYEGEALLESWLCGDKVPLGELRRFGIYETLERQNAFQCLCSMSQVLVNYGYPGVVLMFDEADRNLSVSRKKIQAIGDNLRKVIDLCGGSKLPGVFFLYAVPPEFMRQIVPEYPALEQRLRSPLPMTRHSPQAAIIDLEKLELEPVELLKSIGERLLDVSKVAWGWEPSEMIQVSNLNRLAEAASQYVFEVTHRRLFVKTWISFLYSQHLNGESMLSENDAAAMITGAAVTEDEPGEEGDFSDF
ncbi:MAG: DUF2791 family P-loop domain-containing protein [bacterium]|nr:DUF2791 family P-loop domain-containing protein [bacterium]